MAKEDFLKTWDDRRCNIGDCPAFHLTDQDWQDIVKSSKTVRQEGMQKAVEQWGIPVGTCKVSGKEVVVNSPCSVAGDSFYDYFGKENKG